MSPILAELTMRDWEKEKIGKEKSIRKCMR
jgi:hypothetical protein